MRTRPLSTPGAAERWQALVIGAGPGGAVAAKLLADSGVRTLLVEAKHFPREKVCGGCLNQRAIATLRQAGLGDALDSCEGVPIEGVELRSAGRALLVSTPRGLAVTRATLDARLSEAISQAGVEVRFGSRAEVLPHESDGGRRVRLTDNAGRVNEVEASVVVAADGLGSPSLSRLADFQTKVHPSSHLGVGAVLDGAGANGVPHGRITMAIGDSGYVGLVCCERGRLNLAGALAPSAVKRRDAIPALVARTLEQAGVGLPDGLLDAAWRGTRQLTQSATRLAGPRLFLIGDSSGYVEPFTGEGMAAAVEDATAVASFAARAASEWDDSLASGWQAELAARRRQRQSDCQQLAWLLRRPWATRLGMRLAASWPALGERISHRVSAPGPNNLQRVA